MKKEDLIDTDTHGRLLKMIIPHRLMIIQCILWIQVGHKDLQNQKFKHKFWTQIFHIFCPKPIGFSALIKGKNKTAPPNGIKLYAGSLYIIATREFMNWTMNNSTAQKGINAHVFSFHSVLENPICKIWSLGQLILIRLMKFFGQHYFDWKARPVEYQMMTV